jgi:hypothetical protein
MKYRGIVLIVGLLSVATAWAFGHARRAPRPEASAVTAARPADPVVPDPDPAPVRIEQRLVRVDIVQAPAPAQRRFAVAKRQVTPKAGLFARARRVLFGEGRHKPAPFPALQ